MFSMFLYLTLYIQDVLEFSPLEAGVRFLPITLLSFFAAPLAANLSNRIPVRVLMGTGLVLVGVGLLLMHGIEAGEEWTHLLPGFAVAGIGARGASGNGFRHQLDVPPGWDRDRCRGSRGRLPVADHDQAVGTRPASSARGGGGGLVRGDRTSRGGRPSAASSPGG